MRKVQVTHDIPLDPISTRQSLEQLLTGCKTFSVGLPLREFAIPGGLVVYKEIVVTAYPVLEDENLSDRIQLEFKATEECRLFPVFRGYLEIIPNSAGCTLDLCGRYQPPLGEFGMAFDMTIGSRIAERTMTTFLKDIASDIQAHAPAKV